MKKKTVSNDRYTEIMQYKDLIQVEPKIFGYANFTTKVHINNKIPIVLTDEEIAIYADNGWTYNFGYKVILIERNEEETIYYVKVYID